MTTDGAITAYTEADEFSLEPIRDDASTAAIFAGDEGSLDVNQRRALVVLLKQRFISSRTHPAEWRTLTENPRPIRSRLHDVFLELVIDAEREVAYKRQVRAEGGRPFPTLFNDTAWPREDTVLLVYLRTKARAEQAAGSERAFVDRDDMFDYIRQHRPDHATDRASDAKRTDRAIGNLITAGLLIGRSDADRFEISRAIESLLPLEKLQELQAWLVTQNRRGPDNDPDDANDRTNNDSEEPG